MQPDTFPVFAGPYQAGTVFTITFDGDVLIEGSFPDWTLSYEDGYDNDFDDFVLRVQGLQDSLSVECDSVERGESGGCRIIGQVDSVSHWSFFPETDPSVAPAFPVALVTDSSSVTEWVGVVATGGEVAATVFVGGTSQTLESTLTVIPRTWSWSAADWSFSAGTGPTYWLAEDGLQGLDAARRHAPDLMILDLMLPGIDGYRVLQTLRGEGMDAPVLILTARGEETDKVLGFRLGADEYVTKPFGVLELLARVDAILRRTGGQDTHGPPRLEFGDVEVDVAARRVIRDGEDISLTPKEFDLLLALIRREGAVASRIELMKEVWGHRAAVVSRTVDTHVAELRRKLEAEPRDPCHILTVHKAGYRFQG